MWRVVLAGAGVAVIVSLTVAQTGANMVPSTKVSDTSRPITVNTVKPAACAGLALTTLIVGDGNIDAGGPTTTADLILGGPAAQTIRGRGGDDCIVGGDGDDSIRCDAGTDVAIGGPGTDSFNADCETQIQ